MSSFHPGTKGRRICNRIFLVASEVATLLKGHVEPRSCIVHDLPAISGIPSVCTVKMPVVN